MMHAELVDLVSKALPVLTGLAFVTIALSIYLLYRNWKCDAGERGDARTGHLHVPMRPSVESSYDREENWLRVLMADLQARGIHDFTDESDSSTDDETEEDVAPDSPEQRELTSVLDATGLSPPGGKNAIARSIWKDTPLRGWPRRGGQFEFKHLPTGSVVVLTRSNVEGWVAFAGLPRTSGVRELRFPETFKHQYMSDWVGAWSFSEVPTNKPREAIDVAKRWLLAALSGEIEVTEGALTPTRNKERDYFGPRTHAA